MVYMLSDSESDTEVEKKEKKVPKKPPKEKKKEKEEVVKKERMIKTGGGGGVRRARIINTDKNKKGPGLVVDKTAPTTPVRVSLLITFT